MIFLTLLALVSIIQIGLTLNYFLFKKVNLLLSLGIGMGGVTIIQLFLGVLGIRVNQELVLLISFLSLLTFLNKTFRTEVTKQLRTFTDQYPQPQLVIILTLGIILTILTFSHIIWGHDAYSHWLSKSRAFWVDQGITPTNIKVYWPFDYPLLWPLVTSWFYFFTSQANGFWIRIIPLAVYLNLALIFASLTKRGRFSLIWLVVLILTPFVYQNVISVEFAGNADFLLSYFLFLAIYSLLFLDDWFYAGLFLGLGVLTKNDGLPALVSFILIILWTKKSFNLILLPGGLLIFNLFLKHHYKLESRYLTQDFNLLFSTRSPLENIYYSLHSFREEFRQVYRWGIGWWLILFSLIVNFKIILEQSKLAFSLILILAQILGYLVVYLITPEDPVGQVGSTISRLVLQIYPGMLLISFKTYNLKSNFSSSLIKNR